MRSLGATFRDGLLCWALMERTKAGWAFADGGVHEGETLRAALAEARRRFPRIRPHVGIEWGASELLMRSLEPVREIAAAIRIESNERDRVVESARDGEQRIVCHAARSAVLAAVDPWRACGIDPRSAEPLEVAWLRATSWSSAILNLHSKPAHLLVARHDAVERYRIERASNDDYQSIVLLIRRARHEIGPLARVLTIGDAPAELLREEAGVAFEGFAVAGITSPPWSDAVALATAGYARELRFAAFRGAFPMPAFRAAATQAAQPL